MAFVDLSHTIEEGMITYQGLPAPLICDFLSREASKEHYAAGTTFQIGKIEMVSNTGTYLDSPFHRFADGKDLAGLELSSLAGLEAVVVRVPADTRIVDRPVFENVALRGKAVLVCTRTGRAIGEPNNISLASVPQRDGGELSEAARRGVGGD
jgi:kynurenine formamidase